MQLRFLQLDADPILEPIDVTDGVEGEDRHGASVWSAQALDALHRRRLASSVRSDQPKDLATLDIKRHIVDGELSTVALVKAGDADGGFGGGHNRGAMSSTSLHQRPEELWAEDDQRDDQNNQQFGKHRLGGGPDAIGAFLKRAASVLYST